MHIYLLPPQEYTLIGENACPTCTCTYGCCIWAAVDHVNKIGWFKAGDTKLVTDCPTTWIGYQASDICCI